PETVTEREPFVLRKIRPVYLAVLQRSLKHRFVTVMLALGLLAATLALAPRLGTEFLPKLEEGNLWIRATLPPTISLDAGEPYVARMRDVLTGFPEVITVVSQHGRPDDGTDPTGFFNVEFFAPLKPFEQWPKGVTKIKLIEQMKAELQKQFVGVDF